LLYLLPFYRPYPCNFVLIRNPCLDFYGFNPENIELQGVKSGEILLNATLVPLAPTKPAAPMVQAKAADSMLCVDLIKASKLAKSDLIGKSDPYAVIKFGQQTAKTKVVNNSQVVRILTAICDFRTFDL
jgi:Ca2+-dependent lipid-binding protein